MRVFAAVILCIVGLAAPPASAQLAAELRVTCWLADVGVFANRVHVHCSNGPPGGGLVSHLPPPRPDPNVVYFAVGAVSDPNLANRVVALATAAMQQGKQVEVQYRSDPLENPPGCLTADCRRLTGLVLMAQP
jgi:hypothetical protein